jgi:hypothetical protein
MEVKGWSGVGEGASRGRHGSELAETLSSEERRITATLARSVLEAGEDGQAQEGVSAQIGSHGPLLSRVPCPPRE